MRAQHVAGLGALLLLCGACSPEPSYRPPDASWPIDVLSEAASPVDLRFLNHARAGEHGFLRAVHDRLEFEDGTAARFWGANLAAHALFVDDVQITAQARRIAMLGFNLVRIHHHDSTRWVEPTVIDSRRGDSRSLDPDALERLDAWIEALARNGVYVWLDLHVGRQFTPSDVDTEHGTIEGYSEIANEAGLVNGFAYYNPTVRALMQEFNERYLTHRNTRNGLRYVDDPAVMGVLVTNENDLTHHYGQKMLEDKGNPVHRASFLKKLRAFARRTGLDAADLERTWVPGPSKLLLNDDEYFFQARMLRHLASLGLRVPAATTSLWGGGGVHSLPALTAGDWIDVHAYGRAEALSIDPRKDYSYIHRMGFAQVVDMPLTASEWNTPFPIADRFTAPLYVASIASLQGWDALMLYNYSQEPRFALRGSVPEWSSFADPALVGAMPAAALLYRTGHVAPAARTYCLDLDREQVYFQEISPATSAAVRTLIEQSGFRICLPDAPELDWDRAHPPGPGIETVRNPASEFLRADAHEVVSDTGELRRDWEIGVQTIDTARTQAVSGWIGGRSIALDTARFEISTPKAVVAVSSIDGEAIERSRHILVTALAQAASLDGSLPLRAEPVTGRLTLRAPPGLALRPVQRDGTEGDALPIVREGDAYVITMSGSWHWLVLRKPAGPAKAAVTPGSGRAKQATASAHAIEGR